MVVGPGGAVIAQRNLKLSAARIAIGRRHCSVPRGTALAALVAGRFDLGVVDLAGCDPTQMFVRRIGTYRNHGAAGWEYKVGHRDPSFGAADPGGRLRSGQRLLWYWCARAGACERTLEVTLRGSRARVIGYDDNGHGRPIAGATVHLDTTTVITGADGTATLTVTPGRHTLYATKRGLVPSFAERFTAA
jgi:hypothetical protein